MKEIKAIFNDQPLNLLDSNWICFDKLLFPMDQNHFFYISYRYRNETINKKIAAEHECILLLKDDLFKVDGKRISKDSTDNFELYYYQADHQISEKLTNMSFEWNSNQYYVGKIRQLLKGPAFKDRTDEQILKGLLYLWRDEYGFIHPRSLKSLLLQSK